MQKFFELCDELLDEVVGGNVVDPILCPQLIAAGAATGGGIPGVVDINAQGDVFLLGSAFWDCPPYDL